METMTAEKKETTPPFGGVHMGQNIRIARTVKGYSQEALGLDLDLRQNQVSELEKMPVIEDDILIGKVARILDCDVRFIKEYRVEHAMRSYDIHENEFSNNGAENSHDMQALGNSIDGNGIDIETQNNYTYPIDDIKALYEKLIAEKDKQLQRFEKELDEIKAKMQEIEKGK